MITIEYNWEEGVTKTQKGDYVIFDQPLDQ